MAYNLQFFKYKHLPEHLQKISKPFALLAADVDSFLDDGKGKDEALLLLLQSKDSAVRAKGAKDLF
jgi:hypothetical protein